jgi:GAF domain-containing protein
MAAPLAPQALKELERVSRLVKEEKDRGKLFELIMDCALGITGAERGFLVLVKPGVGIDIKVARNLRKEHIEHPRFQFSRGIIFETLKTGRPQIVEDAKEDPGFSERASVTALRLASVACVPLKAAGNLQGVLYLDNRLKAGIFRAEHATLLQAFADRAAEAIAATT